MLVISSSEFLNEFTVYANQTYEKEETVIVQRGNGKNVVVMSMDKFNEIQKMLFMAKEGKLNKE